MLSVEPPSVTYSVTDESGVLNSRTLSMCYMLLVAKFLNSIILLSACLPFHNTNYCLCNYSLYKY